MNRKLNNWVAWGIFVPFLLVIGFLLFNKTAVNDWLYFRTYSPESQIKSIAEAADMSDDGQRLFFRADPELISRERVGLVCLGADNLGCLVTGPKIFILKPDSDTRATEDQAVATGAHEMLHMVYFRESKAQKNELHRLIDQALSRTSNSRFQKTLDETSSDAEYYDEAHSILGTEIERLPSELEAHYQQYFNDRDDILEAFNRSKGLL